MQANSIGSILNIKAIRNTINSFPKFYKEKIKSKLMVEIKRYCIYHMKVLKG